MPMLVKNQSVLQISKSWGGRHFPEFGDQMEIIELPFRRKFSLSTICIPVKQIFDESTMLDTVYDRGGDQLPFSITQIPITYRD